MRGAVKNWTIFGFAGSHIQDQDSRGGTADSEARHYSREMNADYSEVTIQSVLQIQSVTGTSPPHFYNSLHHFPSPHQVAEPRTATQNTTSISTKQVSSLHHGQHIALSPSVANVPHLQPLALRARRCLQRYFRYPGLHRPGLLWGLAYARDGNAHISI
jgi:hypothetical protein